MRLRDLPLVRAAVPVTATFGDAAARLLEASVGAIAVLDRGRVVGVVTQDAVVRGLFPPYLDDLTHSAFAADDPVAAQRAAREAVARPVVEHMTETAVLEAETSPAHAAERFLHCEAGALPVVESGRFVGMLDEREFARAIWRRVGGGR